MSLTKRRQLTANKKSRNSNGVQKTKNVVDDGVPNVIHEDQWGMIPDYVTNLSQLSRVS